MVRKTCFDRNLMKSVFNDYFEAWNSPLNDQSANEIEYDVIYLFLFNAFFLEFNLFFVFYLILFNFV